MSDLPVFTITRLFAVDRDTMWTSVCATGSKEADDYAVKELMKFVKQIGVRDLEVRSDTEPTTHNTILITMKSREQKTMLRPPLPLVPGKKFNKSPRLK